MTHHLEMSVCDAERPNNDASIEIQIKENLNDDKSSTKETERMKIEDGNSCQNALAF